jgi:hypothetical protein
MRRRLKMQQYCWRFFFLQQIYVRHLEFVLKMAIISKSVQNCNWLTIKNYKKMSGNTPEVKRFSGMETPHDLNRNMRRCRDAGIDLWPPVEELLGFYRFQMSSNCRMLPEEVRKIWPLLFYSYSLLLMSTVHRSAKKLLRTSHNISL